MTEWRDIEGFVGRYQVSDDGRVRSLSRIVDRGQKGRSWMPGRILKPCSTYGDYLVVKLSGGDAHKTLLCSIHRLVAEAFIPKFDGDGDLVLHGDGDPHNNTVTNLRWGNYSENQLDAISHGTHPQAKKTHCKWGHPFTEQNTIVRNPAGRRPSRLCRTCRERYYATQRQNQELRAQVRRKS